MSKLIMLLEPIWRGHDVVCIGGGPSLDTDQIRMVLHSGARVIAINDAYLLAPWADTLYACDLKWWDWHNGCHHFRNEKLTCSVDAAKKYGLEYVPGRGNGLDEPPLGLSDDPGLIHYGRNSGFQAINIAYLRGARRIILIGYDMKISQDGRSHWFGDHPDGVRFDHSQLFAHFDAIAAENKVEIINATPGSALPSFPRGDLGDVLHVTSAA